MYLSVLTGLSSHSSPLSPARQILQLLVCGCFDRVLTPCPKSFFFFSDESVSRSDPTGECPKDPTGECRQQKHAQQLSPRRRNVTTSMFRLKTHSKNLIKNSEPQRYSCVTMQGEAVTPAVLWQASQRDTQ